MALTDENIIADVLGRYGLEVPEGETWTLTVYRAIDATDEQLSADYLQVEFYGTKIDGQHELLVVGEQTISDTDGVWEEWTGV